MLGGTAGLLMLAVYQSGILAVLQLCSFTVCCFSTGMRLRKPSSRTRATTRSRP